MSGNPGFGGLPPDRAPTGNAVKSWTLENSEWLNVAELARVWTYLEEVQILANSATKKSFTELPERAKQEVWVRSRFIVAPFQGYNRMDLQHAKSTARATLLCS